MTHMHLTSDELKELGAAVPSLDDIGYNSVNQGFGHQYVLVLSRLEAGNLQRSARWRTAQELLTHRQTLFTFLENLGSGNGGEFSVIISTATLPVALMRQIADEGVDLHIGCLDAFRSSEGEMRLMIASPQEHREAARALVSRCLQAFGICETGIAEPQSGQACLAVRHIDPPNPGADDVFEEMLGNGAGFF